MNAPTMLIHKYIYLWPTKINHGYTVGATIGRLFSNYLNYFSYINQQPKQIARQALFGKESCQRSWLRDWIISACSPTPSWLTVKLYISPKQQKSRWLLSSALSGSHSQARRKRPRRENCTLYSFLFPAFTPLSLRSPTPSWLTAKLYTNHKFVKANKKADDFYHLLSLAPTVGLEPTTSWLTVKRSTDWAMREYLILF